MGFPLLRALSAHWIIVSGPQDQPFGHRTLFLRDPDGNALEIYTGI